MYTQIDPADRDAVAWLQLALARLFGHAPLARIGLLDSLTRRAIAEYQRKHSLPLTGEADAATLQSINQELAALDAKAS
jgi:hypothetical protein